MAALSPAYRPRRPTETIVYAIVRDHLATFLSHARETYNAPLPRYVDDELPGYLRCGVFAHGFLRAHCSTCGNDLLVAFSCKARGVCPSCAGRRMANTAAHLVDRVLPAVAIHQWVLSLPFQLRRLAAFDANALTRIFVEALSDRYRAWGRGARLGSCQTGAVTFVQRFGSSLNLTFTCTSSSRTASSFARWKTSCSTRRRFYRAASSITFSNVCIAARPHGSRGMATSVPHPSKQTLTKRLRGRRSMRAHIFR